MRIPSTIFRKYVICALFAILSLQTVCTCAAPGTPQAGAGQAPQKMLEALDAFSPSNPDPKDLVELFQMRTAFADEEIRRHVEDLVAVGFVVAKHQDIYLKRVRPALADPSRIEKEGQRDCPVCKGAGQNTIKCGRCGALGHCSVCKGTGTKRVNVDNQMLKGPVAAHQKPKEEFKEIPCANCKGTGKCPDCNGEGKRKTGCPNCLFTGKVWDAAAANSLAMEAYDALYASLKLKVFEASIPKAMAIVSAGETHTLAPVFVFGDRRVAAIPARAAIGISGLSVFSHDKRPVPFSSVLASSNRDLVLIDLAQSSIVTPLELEASAANLDTGRRVYAYGTSREDGAAQRLDGKILAAGPLHFSTSVDSKTLVDCAPLITDDGKLGGLFMYPMAEFNSSGAISLMQNNGSALRLDNLLPADFTSVSIGDLNLRNNALTFAKRAIQSAKELLDMDNQTLALRQSSIKETIQRLDRAVEMIKGVRQWELFMMEETARELTDESKVRARNLEARIAQIEAEKRATAQAARDAAEQGTNVMENVATPQNEDEPSAEPAKEESAKPAKDNPANEKDDVLAGLNLNWRKIITITVIAIVAITVVFVLIGVIQDKIRKSKLAEPPKIPDFIREMQEYEQKHPDKKE